MFSSAYDSTTPCVFLHLNSTQILSVEVRRQNSRGDSLHEIMCCAVPSRSVMSDSLLPHGLWPTRILCPWESPGKNTGVGCHALLQGIFPTQGSNPDLPHCRWIFYQLSHEGVPRILEWVPSPADLPNSGIKPGSPAVQADSLQLSYQGSPT